MRADVHVLDHCGNVADACVLSALAGLLAFRRPDVTVGGGGDGVQVTVLCHPGVRVLQGGAATSGMRALYQQCGCERKQVERLWVFWVAVCTARGCQNLHMRTCARAI